MLFICLLDRSLVAFVVDHVYQILLAIRVDLLLQMPLHHLSLNHMKPSRPIEQEYPPQHTESGLSMICKSGLYLNVFTSAQYSGILPRICTKLKRAPYSPGVTPGLVAALGSMIRICSVSLKLAT